MADITTSSDPKTLQTQAEQLAPYMAQAFRQMTRDVATITKWNTGDFDYTQIYSMPVVYYDAASGKTLRIQVLMSAIVKALEDGAKEELTAIKASATEAAESAADSKEAAEAAKTQAEQSAATAAAQKDETISYLNTVKRNEAERVSAENARAKAETARANAEQNRAKAESARVEAETTRKNAWTAWFEDTTNGVKALWTKWFTDTKNSFNSWFGATASEGIRGEVASWFTSAKDTWNSWFGTSSTTGVQGSWATLKSDATNATAKANDATTASQKQTESCKSATDLADELNAHPQMQGENGNWWKWNTETDQYEDTGIIARGGAMYPRFRSRRNHVLMYDETDGFKNRVVRRRNHAIIKF